MAHRYSVYERGTDRPIAIWRSAEKCAEVMGLKLNSFYKQILRAQEGRPHKKYEIVVHTEKEEDVLP